MTTDEYVPGDDDVRESYVHGETCDREGGVWDAEVPGAQESFTRWLAAHDARVRRDAAREALDGLVDEFGPMVDRTRIADYRDTHYPEETP